MKYIVIWVVTIISYGVSFDVDEYTGQSSATGYYYTVTTVDTLHKWFDNLEEAKGFIEGGKDHPQINTMQIDSVSQEVYLIISKN